MATDPYAAFATPVGQTRETDPYAALGTPVAAPVRRVPAARQAAPVAAVDDFATPVADDTTNGFTTDQVPMELGNPGTQGNPLDTSLMDDAAKSKLKAGTWVIGPDGPTPLTGDPFRSEIQPGDKQLDGQNFRERGGVGYNAALEQEKGRSQGVGFASQTTAPLNDELAWLAGYGQQGVSNLVDRLSGRTSDISAMGRANAARDAYKAEQDAYQKEHPLLSATGQVLGGFAAGPVAGVRTALGGRLAQAAATGGAYGFAEGDGLTDRAVKGGIGTLFGLGTAGVLEGGGAGLGAATRAIRDRAIPAIERQSNRVGDFLARALRRDSRTPADVERVLAESPNLFPYQAGGRNFAATAEAAASAPGRAQQIIGERIGQRAENATSRIQENASRELGGTGNFFADLDDSLAARAEQAKTGMEAFGNSPITLDENAQAALASPRVRTALADSAENLLSSIDPVEREAGARLARLARDAENGVMPAGMTVREAQDVSRALNEASSAAWSNGDGARGKVLGSLGKAIRQNARDEVPAYNAWLREYSDASGVMDATRLGFSIFEKASERNPVSARQLQRAFADMSQMEKDAFRKGVSDQLLEQVGTKGGVTAMRALARGPEYGDRVRVAFPDEASFNRFLKSAGEEIQIRNSDTTILGGSRTAPRAAAIDELTQANGLNTGEVIGAAGDLATGNVPGLMARIGSGIARRVPNTGTNIIGNEATNELLGEALTDSDVLRRLLESSEVRRMIREQSAGNRLRALQGPGVLGAGSNALNPIQ